MLDYPHVARMSRVCKTLREKVPRLLLDGTVTVLTKRHLPSFHAFMFADRQRFKFLRRLELLEVNGGHDDEALRQAAMRVVTLLSHAAQLEWLQIEESALLEVYSPLPYALSSLANLQSLHLTDVAKATIRIIGTLTLPLAEISMVCRDYSPYEDPRGLLAPFKDTMTIVTVSQAEMSSVADPAASVSFPLVKTLHLNRCYHVDLKALEDSFPNLRRLSIQLVHESEDTEEIEQERFLNLARDARPWDSLAMLRGTVAGLYSLGINCGVEHLDVDTEWPVVEPEDYERLTSLLAALRPSILELSLSLPDLDTQLLQDSLSVVAGTLQYLRLVLHWDRIPFDSFSNLHCLLFSLPCTALRHLQIKFHNDPSPLRQGWESPILYGGVEDLVELDTQELGTTALCIPTLQYLCLEPDCTVWPRPEMFEVREGAEGRREPVKLPWARMKKLSQESPFPTDD